MPKAKIKTYMGVQQVLLQPDTATRSLLLYVCQQSGKLYNNGVD
ncbi:hypothetical protein [Microseira sp. BLCC-F43]